MDMVKYSFFPLPPHYGKCLADTLNSIMQKLPLIFLSYLMACGQSSDQQTTATVKNNTEDAPAIYYSTIGEIPVPDGYKRVPAGAGTFDEWARTIPLKKDKTVYLYNGSRKRNQAAQYAVVDIPTGKQDLQQCADVVMRLRAEYLFSQKKYNEIAFMDYSGKWYKWERGNDRSAFDRYLQTVFGWCGSASLEKQLTTVSDFNSIKAGDVLVQGGFPGHAMIVVDMAVNANGKKVYMMVQGYQPAQDMHVVVNPQSETGSPWYEVTSEEGITTPEWQFTQRNLKTW